MLVTGRDPRRGIDAANDLRRAAGHERVGFIRVDHSTVAANLARAERLQGQLGQAEPQLRPRAAARLLDELSDRLDNALTGRKET